MSWSISNSLFLSVLCGSFLSGYLFVGLLVSLFVLLAFLIGILVVLITESDGILSLGFGLDIDLVSGKTCGKSRILSFLTDGK